MLYVMVEHPAPARALPQMRSAYRSTPLNPAFGLYRMRIAPSSDTTRWLARDAIDSALSCDVELLRK